ncbi:MAG: ATPase, partial [Bacteroidia bacterium]|nr:ATPase [Bacteroidia bacterium]
MTGNYYNIDQEEVLREFDVNPASGLSSDEAAKRIETYGYNQLLARKRKSFVKMFLDQFKSFMIVILLIAAIISGITGILDGEGLLDTFVILGILIVNALIGATQEMKAENSLEALQNLSAPMTKVCRDGKVVEVATKELVPGDIVVIETGDIVPADLRLLETFNLKIQESAMTGESLPVEKQTERLYEENISLGDRTNMAFTSGIVTYGRGRGVVVATAMKTEVGKIASMIQQTEDTETPMKLRLEQLGKYLGIAALAICGVIFLVGILYSNPVLDMFMTAVSLAVAAIPEGLPAISTVVLAIGVQRLVKKNAIIRTLPSVETLGSATVICSDKTGTLTQNRMTVVNIFTAGKSTRIDNIEKDYQLTESEQRLLKGAVLCSDAHLSRDEEGNFKTTGDPTETALIDAGVRFSVDKNHLETGEQRVGEIPFDSERKRMTTINKIGDGQYVINVKGGLDEVMSVCSRIYDNGNI